MNPPRISGPVNCVTVLQEQVDLLEVSSFRPPEDPQRYIPEVDQARPSCECADDAGVYHVAILVCAALVGRPILLGRLLYGLLGFDTRKRLNVVSVRSISLPEAALAYLELGSIRGIPSFRPARAAISGAIKATTRLHP